MTRDRQARRSRPRAAPPAKTLVLVRSGWRLPFRLLAFRTFAALGWRVAVVERVLNQSLRVADVPVVSDMADPARTAEAVLARVGRADGVLTFSDSGLVGAAELAKTLGLPFLSAEAARRAVDKREQRRAFAAAGLPVPEWREVAGPEDALDAVRQWGRAVLKPADRAASVAVRAADTPAEADRAYRDAASASRRPGSVLAEQYLAGPEVSVESIAVEGRQQAVCVTDKLTTPGPSFVEISHSLPSALPAPERRAAVEAAVAACDALGLNWGGCHTEVKLTDSGPVVVEVNARLAGDCIVDLVEMALGLNLYELAGRQALGESIGAEDLSPSRRGAAAIHFCLCRPGVFRGAGSPLEASSPDWLEELSVTATPGQRLGEPRANADRIGYAIATACSGPEAARRARSAVESLALDVAPA